MTKTSQSLQWNKKFAKSWNKHDGLFEKVNGDDLFEDFHKEDNSLAQMKKEKMALLKIKDPQLLKKRIKEYVFKWYGSGRTINVVATEKMLEDCVKKGSFFE